MQRVLHITRLTETGDEPVSLSELKAFMQLEGTAYDAPLTASIKAARELIEGYCSVSLKAKSYRVVIRNNDYETIRLPRLPITSITTVAWRKCPSTLIELVLDTDYYNYGDGYLHSDTYKGEFTITYVAGVDASEIYRQAIKELIRAAFDADNTSIILGITDNIKRLLQGYVRRAF